MQIIYIVMKADSGELLGTFQSKELANKSRELSVSRITDPVNKEIQLNNMAVVPCRVLDRVEHL